MGFISISSAVYLHRRMHFMITHFPTQVIVALTPLELGLLGLQLVCGAGYPPERQDLRRRGDKPQVPLTADTPLP